MEKLIILIIISHQNKLTRKKNHKFKVKIRKSLNLILRELPIQAITILIKTVKKANQSFIEFLM